MQTREDVRRSWRALTPAEKQRRLERWRRSQHQQLLRDARALGLREP
jgi:hypothetical protein